VIQTSRGSDLRVGPSRLFISPLRGLAYTSTNSVFGVANSGILQASLAVAVVPGLLICSN
jgi:hypothetical protein